VGDPPPLDHLCATGICPSAIGVSPPHPSPRRLEFFPAPTRRFSLGSRPVSPPNQAALGLPLWWRAEFFNNRRQRTPASGAGPPRARRPPALQGPRPFPGWPPITPPKNPPLTARFPTVQPNVLRSPQKGPAVPQRHFNLGPVNVVLSSPSLSPPKRTNSSSSPPGEAKETITPPPAPPRLQPLC